MTMKDMIRNKIKNGTYQHISHAWMYSTKTGVMSVCEGDVYLTGNGRSDKFIFVVNGDTRKNFCAEQPGVVQNGLVWFEERDDEAAKWVLIQYEYDCITQLEKSIRFHTEKIKHIKNSEP